MMLSIVLPAYNEGSGIEHVVRDLFSALREHIPSFEIIVVDNGSKDNTEDVLNTLKKEIPELVSVKVFPNEGFGNGILEGLKAAKGDILGWMPADGQIEASGVVRAYKKMLVEDLGVCKGVRENRSDNIFRLIQSKVYNTIFSLLFGVNFKDVNAPPKLFKRDVYDSISLSSKDWFIDPELLLKAKAFRFKIGESEVIAPARSGGKSNVKLGTVFEFLVNMVKYKIFLWRLPKRK